MRTITFTDMPVALGINTLTGEACAYSMRILCDLNEDGVELIAEYFGLPKFPLPALEEKMNSTVGNKPSVGSMMLPRTGFSDLIRFKMFSLGYKFVVGQLDGTAFTGFDEQSYENYPALKMYTDGTSVMLKDNGGQLVCWRNPRGSGGQPFAGSRNVHAFTGRTR